MKRCNAAATLRGRVSLSSQALAEGEKRKMKTFSLVGHRAVEAGGSNRKMVTTGRKHEAVPRKPVPDAPFRGLPYCVLPAA